MPLSKNPGEEKKSINIDNNLSTDITSDKNATFDSIISKFKNSGDLGLKSEAVVLKGLKKTLESKNLSEVNTLLFNLSNTNRSKEIEKYIGKLENIASKYEAGNKGVNKETKDKLLSSKIEKLKEEAKDIKDKFIGKLDEQVEKQSDGIISLDLGDKTISFPSKEEALAYIEKLEEGLSGESESTILAILLWSTDMITQPIQWPFEYINEYVRPNLSKDTSEWEWAGDIIAASLLLAMSANYMETIYRKYAVDVFAKMGKNEHPFLKEKIKDENGNYIKEEYKVKNKKGEEIEKERYKTRKKRLVIPDFSKTPKNILQGEEASLYNEYLQRISVLDQLEAILEGKNGKEKELYRVKLEKVKSLLNVNTKSFYLEAFALKKGIYTSRRFYWALRNGVIPFGQDLAQKAQTVFNTGKNEIIDKYNEGYKLIFEDGKVELVDDKIKVSVDSDKGYKKTYKAVIEYIENLSLLENEKKERIDRVNNFVNSLKNIPKTEDYIKNKLYNIAVKGELNKSEILSEIDKKLKEYIPEENKLETKGWIDWFSDLPKEAQEEIFDKLSKLHGNKGPAILTKGHAGLIKLRYFVDKGFINLNEKELTILVDEIEKGNIEFNRLYKGTKGKFKFIGDLSGKLFLKILKGDPIEFTEMKKTFDKIDEADWKKFIKEGESILKSKGEVSGIIRSGAGKNLFSLINLDKSRFNENFEPIFEEIYNSIKEKIDGGDSNYTKERLELDLAKIYKGYLPSFVILDIFDGRNNYKIDSVDLSGLDLEKKEVKEFLEKVEKGEWHGTIEELKISIAKLIRGIAVDGKDFNENVSELIKDINSQGAELEKASFRNSAFGIPFNDGKIEKALFENTEYRLAELLHKLNGDNLNDSKFNQLFEYLLDKNGDYTGKDFFTRLTHSLSLPTDLITVTDSTSRNNLLNNLGERIDLLLNARINNLKTKTSVEQERIIKELYRLLGISETSKESELIKILKQEKVGGNIGLILDEMNTYEKGKEDVKIVEAKKEKQKDKEKQRQEKDINKKINKIDKQIEELISLSKSNNLKELQEAYKELYKTNLDLGNDINLYKEKIKVKIEILELEKLKLTDLAEYSNRFKIARKKAILRNLLDGKNASDVNVKTLNDVAEIEIKPEYENIIETFVEESKKVEGLEGFDYSSFEKALENNVKERELIEKIDKAGKTKLKKFFEEFKKHGKDFIKEFKKHA